MTQAQLARRHRLPHGAFDILEWTVGRDVTGIDAITDHRLRYKVPAPLFFMKPSCFENNLLTGTEAPIPFYNVPARYAEAMNTHDYTRPSWGHSVTFHPKDGGLRGTMLGFGEGVEAGHFLLVRNGNGSTRYQVKEINYYRDPSDMWAAEVVFAPRPSTEIR